MQCKRCILYVALVSSVTCRIDCETITLPSNLLLGSATSAYQIEGAWNQDGKGESVWDRMTHTVPSKIRDRSNGDIACDSYHNLKNDIAIIRELGLQFYRFSLSWSRILPDGFANKINHAGIRYYNDLINNLRANGITPVVTLFHWDLPQPLQNLGGWANPKIADWFHDYAKIVFENFGDRVKLWITVNEPSQICSVSYALGDYPPGVVSDGIGNYICGHNLLKAHAGVYHLYQNVYKLAQKGRIGLNIDCAWYEPASNNTEDRTATERRRQFEHGMYAHPIFGKGGDYPKLVRHRVDQRSKMEGFARSRLPQFTAQEIEYIEGSADFFGVSHYASLKVKDRQSAPIGEPSEEKDIQAEYVLEHASEKHWSWYFKSVPTGLRSTLREIKERYQNPDIFIFETGIPDEGELDDHMRVKYFSENLAAVVMAMQDDGVKVQAFTAWSLMDSFEWLSGYTFGFGLYYVNFTSPERTRMPKLSAKFYKELLRTRKLICND